MIHDHGVCAKSSRPGCCELPHLSIETHFSIGLIGSFGLRIRQPTEEYLCHVDHTDKEEVDGESSTMSCKDHEGYGTLYEHPSSCSSPECVSAQVSGTHHKGGEDGGVESKW